MSDLTMSARVGANVRRLRQEQRLTLHALSELLHDAGTELSVSGLSRLETGERPVSVDELTLLADVLDEAPMDLLEQRTVATGATPRQLVDPHALEVLASAAISAELRRLMSTVAANLLVDSDDPTART